MATHSNQKVIKGYCIKIFLSFIFSGQKGELCIRGPCCFPGYWNQPEKTKEVMGDDKWYKTGDLAVFTDEGYCKIVGRAKDMIIRYLNFLMNFFYQICPKLLTGQFQRR